MKRPLRIILTLLTIVSYLPMIAHAANTFGDISNMVTYLLSEVSDLANVVAFITGAAFGISALIKIQEYRRSPQNMPISRPIIEIVVAIIMIALPFIFSSTADNAIFGKSFR